jgi:hypothetical protein
MARMPEARRWQGCQRQDARGKDARGKDARGKEMASIASTMGHPGGKLLAPPLRAWRFGGAEKTSTSSPRGCPIVEAMLAISLLAGQRICVKPGVVKLCYIAGVADLKPALKLICGREQGCISAPRMIVYIVEGDILQRQTDRLKG